MGGAPDGARGRRRGRGRLSRSGDFDRVYRDGRSQANEYLIVYSFPRSEGAAGESRLGVSVGRKVGGAVIRNRVKRTLREAFRAVADELSSASDFVVVARPALATLVEERGAAGVEEALRTVLSTSLRGAAGE